MYINVPIYGTFFIVMKGVFIMAVNEQIVTGRKFRKLIDEANKLWQRISFWTKASDVEFNDGKNAETKFGAINGVTDSLTSTASNIAASAKAVKTLNDKVTQLSSNIIANKRIAVKALTATIPTGFGTATAQATFTIPKTCPILEIEYGATGGYYYSCELFIDDVSQGADGYQSRTVSKTNVPAGTVIKLVAKRDNPDNLESNVSAYASIAYIHNV